MEENKIIVFEDKKIRRIWQDDQRFFSVVDVILALTDSSIPKRYRTDLKSKLSMEWSEVYEKIVQLKLPASDGKNYKTDCANTENMFRIIQSIPSPKAEPFKRRLAKVWYQRVQEIENPELAQERIKQIYEAKWYPKNWIDKRLRGIAIRQNLTDERKERWISSQSDYAILTAEISRATFGITPSEYKKLKWLSTKNQNLRDHMNDLELIFTMLGERVTTEISQKEKPDGIVENKGVAKRGGSVAGKAREETEKELWDSVISDKNYLLDNTEKS